jgi:excisionase family DNA binding protein
MRDDRILTVDEAAKLVHAAPDTLLQYIRRGELPAARLGKLMLIVYDDLVTFVRKIAAEQASARGDLNVARDRTTTARIDTNQQPPTPPFVLTTPAKSSAGRSHGRRKSLPQLLPDSN